MGCLAFGSLSAIPKTRVSQSKASTDPSLRCGSGEEIVEAIPFTGDLVV